VKIDPVTPVPAEPGEWIQPGVERDLDDRERKGTLDLIEKRFKRLGIDMPKLPKTV
jgi:hypothetical protein